MTIEIILLSIFFFAIGYFVRYINNDISYHTKRSRKIDADIDRLQDEMFKRKRT